jgi:2,5-diamino-6-(ribosylamino)-4(3H)-pyrimidinone 5'-phosphate reductase
MMLPKVVIHNSISLDGSLTGFEVNMALHYQIAAKYRPGAHLIGSNTMKTGIELYGSGVPPEEKKDLLKPAKEASLPYWVIPDTRGSLMGLLHTFRRFEFCRDVIVLISEDTPAQYVEHLKERKYDFHVAGAQHVDLNESLALLSMKYNVKTVLVDTGRILSNLLLEQNLVNEISLLVHPVVVGKNSYKIFADLEGMISLELLRSERFDGSYQWLAFRVKP